MMTRLPNQVVLALGLVVASGCGLDEAPTPEVTVRDSAGIRLVENARPAWADKDVWHLDSVPVRTIGSRSGRPEYLFTRIGDAVLLSDGSVAVADIGTDDVRLFNRQGQFVTYVGRRGTGPGEFERVSGLYRCRGDTLVVNDFYRISVFDASGRFVRSVQITSSAGDGVLRIQGIASDCRTALLRAGLNSWAPLRGKVGRRPRTLLLQSLDDETRDTVSAFGAEEVMYAVVSGMVQPTRLAWGSDAAWATAADQVYLGFTDSPEIRVHDAHGDLSKIVRWDEDSDPVTAADRRLYSERRAYWLGKYPNLEPIIPALGDYPKTRVVKPRFLTILPDDQGYVWLRTYPPSVAGRPDLYDYSNPQAPLKAQPDDDAEPEKWLVLNPAGRLLGRVDIPSDLAVEDIRQDQVLALRRDPQDVETLLVYRLDRNTGH